MALERKAYEVPSIQGQADTVLTVAEQLKGSYKGSVGDPANTILDVNKSFAPSHLFFTDKDLYYSEYQLINPPYVYRLLDFDLRAPYRGGNYKRTEVGLMFPAVIKDTEVPGPGDSLVGKRREPVNIWQDESCPIPDIHYKNFVDFRIHEFKAHFLDSSSYARIKGAVFDAMRKGNACIEKLWVDTFIANLLQIGSYPRGDRLFQFFTKDDTYVPEESFSKVARGFYLKDSEMKKRIIEFGKWVRKHYINRFPYLTNINTHEVIGQALDKSVPEWDKVLVDRSSEDKALAYLRNLYMDKDNNSKYTKVGYTLRRNSLQCFSSAMFRTLRRMMTDNAFNGAGYKYGTEVKDNMAFDLRCRPENLIVVLNNEDLDEMEGMLGSPYTGPFTEQKTTLPILNSFRNMGVSFYPVEYVPPGMAAIFDSVCFRLVEYFNESYSQFFPFDLIDATVHHMFKKPVLYTKVACTVVEPGKDQKYAAPIGGASEHLPLLVEKG